MCEVEGVYMNIRYRILNIDGKKYVLDMGGTSLWKMIFPFLYWLFPMKAYKVDDDELLEKIASPHVEEKNMSWLGVMIGLIVFSFSGTIHAVVKKLELNITSLTSAIILSITFLLVFAFYVYVNIACGKKMRKHIQLEECLLEKLWIRPQSMKYSIKLVLFYLLMTVIFVVMVVATIQLPNGFILFGCTFFLFLIVGLSFATIPMGRATVGFKS